MWFFTLSILLSTTQILHGSEDSQFAIKELHYEISKIARDIQELYVEPDTAQKELDDKTKKALEEYVEMDISSGLPEQIELLDLKDKADDVKTSEETRKGVVDGLDYLGNVKEMKSDEKQLSDIVAQELMAIEEAKKNHFDKDDFEKPIFELETLYEYLIALGHSVDKHEKDKERLEYDLRELKETSHQLMENCLTVLRAFDRVDVADHVKLKFLKVMEKDIADGKEKTGEIRKLKEDLDFIQKISSVKTEIKVMEKLRDSAVVQKILDSMEKIKASFESMKGSGLDHFEWKITYFAQKWIPIQTYLKNLKVSPGDLAGPFTKIEECLKNYDFSMDFSTEETEPVKIEEAFKDVIAKRDLYSSKQLDVQKLSWIFGKIEDLKSWLKAEEKNWDEFGKVMKEFEIDRPRYLMSKIFELEEASYKVQESLHKLDNSVFEAIKTATEGITSKISKIKEFLNCSSSLEVVPSEVKSLMDQPKEVWNFDARSLESVVEVVYLFKEAHRFLDKKEYPIPIDGFPLTKEEVTGISDGLGILKAILDFQKFWTEIPQNFSSSPLGGEFSNLEIHLDLSNIQFPSDIDSTINFYSTEYQGPKQRRILKVLGGVKDYSQFPSKLEKMSEAVGKWKKWKKQLNPEEETVDGEPIDCFERTCELVLPDVNPEEPVKKVEL